MHKKTKILMLDNSSGVQELKRKQYLYLFKAVCRMIFLLLLICYVSGIDLMVVNLF